MLRDKRIQLRGEGNSAYVAIVDLIGNLHHYFECSVEADTRELYDVLSDSRNELNALHARVQELEAENAALHKRIQRVTEETARIVNDMYEKEQNDPATEMEARLFVSGMLSYADYTGDDGDANN